MRQFTRDLSLGDDVTIRKRHHQWFVIIWFVSDDIELDAQVST